MPTLLKMVFDRQEGSNYYFMAGFYNEGLDFNPQFGAGSLKEQAPLQNILSSVPAVLPQNSYVGDYLIPTDLYVRGATGDVWLSEDNLLEEIALWLDDGDILGVLFSEDYEILYTSGPDLALPTVYQDGHDAINHGNEDYDFVVPTTGWPDYEEYTEYDTEKVACSVSREGALLRPAWAWLYTGTINEYHVIWLLNEHPNLTIDPPEPYIDIRWWDTTAPTNWERSWGSYDTRYPEEPFDGWNSPFNGTIIVHEGVNVSYPLPVTVYHNSVIIPFLSPSTYGSEVSIQVPRSTEPFFAFPATPAPPQPTINPLPPVLVIGLAATLSLTNSLGAIKFAHLGKLKAKPIPITNRLWVNESDYLLVNESDYLEVN